MRIKGFIIFIVLFVIAAAIAQLVRAVKISRHMKQQRESGEDKRKVLDLMRATMGDKYPDYTYAVGHDIQTEPGERKIRFYLCSYILAFSEQELIVFLFSVEERKPSILRRQDVSWQECRLEYFVSGNGVRIEILSGEEKLPIAVDRIVRSTGDEQSDTPLGIYQEQEVESLIKLLPVYKQYTTGS